MKTRGKSLTNPSRLRPDRTCLELCFQTPQLSHIRVPKESELLPLRKRYPKLSHQDYEVGDYLMEDFVPNVGSRYPITDPPPDHRPPPSTDPPRFKIESRANIHPTYVDEQVCTIL